MDEAEALADRIMILAAGKIVAEGTPQTIGGRAAGTTLISFTVPEGVQLPALPGQAGQPETARGRVEIAVDDPMPALHAFTEWALAHDIRPENFSVLRPSLEDIYLKLTQEAR